MRFFFTFFLLLFHSLSWAVTLVERGVIAGYPFGGILDPGWEFMNINAYISHPSSSEVPSRNLMGEIPVIIYNSKDERFLKGQVQVHITTPTLVLEKGGARESNSWTGYSNNPFGIVGLAWKLPMGFSLSNAIGGFTPWHSNVDRPEVPSPFLPYVANSWTFVDALGFSHYVKDDHNFTVAMFLGFPGVDYTYHKKIEPDFINLSFTFTKRFQHLEFGPIAYFTADFGRDENASQLAVGPLVGYHWKHAYVQFWWSHDTYQNYFQSNHSGGFIRLAFEFDHEEEHASHAHENMHGPTNHRAFI